MAQRHVCSTAGVVAAALVAVSSSAVRAEDGRFYAGAEDLARAEIKVKGRSLRAAGLAAASAKDRSETGWRIFAGYRIDPYLAVEAGYASIGNFSFESLAPGGTVRVKDMDIHAWNADVVGTLPLPYDFSLFARAGIVRSDADVSIRATGAAVAPRSSASDKSWGYHAGVGVGWDPHRHVGVRLGWERYRIADGLGRDADVDLLSWGIRIRF